MLLVVALLYYSPQLAASCFGLLTSINYDCGYKLVNCSCTLVDLVVSNIFILDLIPCGFMSILVVTVFTVKSSFDRYFVLKVKRDMFIKRFPSYYCCSHLAIGRYDASCFVFVVFNEIFIVLRIDLIISNIFFSANSLFHSLL